jgi:RNA polymerase sigma-70 factor (ECF subfamily)
MMQPQTINALMERASSGDDAAFGALAGAVQDELYRLACALGLGREDAAEATQETLLRAYARRAKWKRDVDVMPWLCGITVNVVRESRRRERRKTMFMRLARLQAPPELASPAGSVDGGMLNAEQLEALRNALADLPERQREAIACRYLRRMSIRETALAMECAEGTVKSAVSAALERLREVLEKSK